MEMSSEKKKELQAQYKVMKTDMGIFAVINKSKGWYFLETTVDLKARLNSTKFKLMAGAHINKQLQKDWQEQGADEFDIEILEKIERDPDECKTDYFDDLELLKMLWTEKLSAANVTLY